MMHQQPNYSSGFEFQPYDTNTMQHQFGQPDAFTCHGFFPLLAKQPPTPLDSNTTPTKAMSILPVGAYASTPSPGTDSSSLDDSERSIRSVEFTPESSGGQLLPASSIGGEEMVFGNSQITHSSSFEMDPADFARLQLRDPASSFFDPSFRPVVAGVQPSTVVHPTYRASFHAQEPLSPTQARLPQGSPTTGAWEAAQLNYPQPIFSHRSRSDSVSSTAVMPSIPASPVRAKRHHDLSISPSENVITAHLGSGDKRLRPSVDITGSNEFLRSLSGSGYMSPGSGSASGHSSLVGSPIGSPFMAQTQSLGASFGQAAIGGQVMTPDSSSQGSERGAPTMMKVRSRSSTTSLAVKASKALKAPTTEIALGRKRSPSVGRRQTIVPTVGLPAEQLPAGYTFGIVDDPRSKNVWPVLMHEAFELALTLTPRVGRRKVTICDGTGESKGMGRNEIIMQLIHFFIGVTRDRKQVSSHLQVLKHNGQDKLFECFAVDREECAWTHPDVLRFFAEVFPYSNVYSMFDAAGNPTAPTSSFKVDQSPHPHRPRVTPDEKAFYMAQDNWVEPDFLARQALEDEIVATINRAKETKRAEDRAAREEGRAIRPMDIASPPMPPRKIYYRLDPSIVINELTAKYEVAIGETVRRNLETSPRGATPSFALNGVPSASNSPALNTAPSTFNTRPMLPLPSTQPVNLAARRRKTVSNTHQSGIPGANLHIPIRPPNITIPTSLTVPAGDDAPAPVTPTEQVHGAPAAPPPVVANENAANNERLKDHWRRTSSAHPDWYQQSPALDGSFGPLSAGGDGPQEPTAAQKFSQMTCRALNESAATGSQRPQLGLATELRGGVPRRATISSPYNGTFPFNSTVQVPQLPPAMNHFHTGSVSPSL